MAERTLIFNQTDLVTVMHHRKEFFPDTRNDLPELRVESALAKSTPEIVK